MGTKNNPGTFDCYANAGPNEPMFVLLAHDEHAPPLVENWAAWRAQTGEDPKKVEEALKCAKAMRKYRYEHRRKLRVEGAPPCEYCMEGSEDCKKISTHVVTDDGFVHHYWCGNYAGYLFAEAGVQTIEEYFSTDEVSNSYIDDVGDECEAADRL